jgi:hypothetical protein
MQGHGDLGREGAAPAQPGGAKKQVTSQGMKWTSTQY